MAKKRTIIDHDMEIAINEAYLEIRTYAGTARKFGIASSTVKNHIIPGYVSQKEIEKNKKKFDFSTFVKPTVGFIYNVLEHNEIADLVCLSDEEKEEMKELWNEVAV